MYQSDFLDRPKYIAYTVVHDGIYIFENISPQSSGISNIVKKYYFDLRSLSDTFYNDIHGILKFNETTLILTSTYQIIKIEYEMKNDINQSNQFKSITVIPIFYSSAYCDYIDSDSSSLIENNKFIRDDYKYIINWDKLTTDVIRENHLNNFRQFHIEYPSLDVMKQYSKYNFMYSIYTINKYRYYLSLEYHVIISKLFTSSNSLKDEIIYTDISTRDKINGHTIHKQIRTVVMLDMLDSDLPKWYISKFREYFDNLSISYYFSLIDIIMKYI